MRLLFIAITLSSSWALAHEEMGPRIDAWAKSLRSKSGESCCAAADGWRATEVTWDIGTGRYRVMIEGEWQDVPDSAVVEGPNRAGFAMVWWYTQWEGGALKKRIRCFIPGDAS